MKPVGKFSVTEFPAISWVCVVNDAIKSELKNGTRLVSAIVAAVTWPPRAPALTLGLGESAMD